MIKTIWFGVISAFLISTGFAQEEAGNLEALKPLVGHTYVGTFPNGDFVDVQTYEWVFGNKFIRNTHEVRNGEGKAIYAGEAIYAVDPKTGELVFWYWNTTGGFVEGSVAEEDGKLIAKGENHGQKGQVDEVRSAMWDIEPGSYKAASYFLKEGTWQEQWTMTFKRKENP